jgi:hypothetical protein
MIERCIGSQYDNATAFMNCSGFLFAQQSSYWYAIDDKLTLDAKIRQHQHTYGIKISRYPYQARRGTNASLEAKKLHAVLRLLIPSLLAVAVTSIGAVIDIAFTSFFRDKGSIAALNNAELLFALPVALLGQVVARAALPRLSLLALEHHCVHLRKLVVKVVGVAVLLSIPAAILLAVLGRPVIHLLFQHGAFTRRSSSLVYIALIGYALILPGRVADELLNRSFYALKDARTPLFTEIIALGARIGLIILLVRLLQGKYLLLSIPLAVGGAAALEAVLLGFLLLARLRTKVKMDRGMQRLQGQRESAESEESSQLYTEPEPALANGKLVEPEVEPGSGLSDDSDLQEPEAQLEPELVSREQEEAESEPNPVISDAMPVEAGVAPGPELADGKLEEVKAEPEPEISRSEQQAATVELEPISSTEQQAVPQAEQEPELSKSELVQPQAEQEPETVIGVQEAAKSVSKPASSTKKRTSSKQGTGKGNRQRQKRSNQNKSLADESL